jgi:hypothetical protein
MGQRVAFKKYNFGMWMKKKPGPNENKMTKREREQNSPTLCSECHQSPQDDESKLCDPSTARDYRYRITELGAFTKMHSGMKKHSLNLHKNDTETQYFAGTCTLTRDDILDIYKAQNKCCAISGLPLTHVSGSHFQTSPNRLDDDVDYDDNVQITALEFNNWTKWTAEKLAELPQKQMEQIPETRYEGMVMSLDKRPRQRRLPQMNDLGQWLCRSCSGWFIARCAGLVIMHISARRFGPSWNDS